MRKLFLSLLCFALASTTWATTYKTANFNGTSNYLQLDDATKINTGANDFSISLWINTTQTARSFLIGKNDQSSPYAGYYVDINGASAGKLRFALDFGSTDAFAVSTSSVNDGNWHHIVLVRDGTNSNMELWVDGTKEATTSISGSTSVNIDNTGLLVIGARQNSSSKDLYYSGSMTSVKMTNNALSSTLIAELYNSGTPKIHGEYSSSITGVTVLAVEAAEDLPVTPYQTDFDALTGLQYNASYDTGSYADSESNTISNTNTTDKEVTVNGKDSLGFNGSSAYQTINSIASTYNGYFEGYIVFKKETSGTFDNMVSWCQYSNNDSYSFLVPRDSDNPQHSIAVEKSGPSNGTLVTEGTSLGDEWAFLRYSYDGSNVKLSVNGSTAASTAQTSQFTSNDYAVRGALVRSANSSGTAFFNGQIAQDILFNTTNSAADITKVEKLLIAKFFPLFDISGEGNKPNTANAPALTGTVLTYYEPPITDKTVNTLALNGTNQSLSVGDASSLELGSSNFTLSAWVNFDAFPNNTPMIFSKWDAGSNAKAFQAYYRNDTNKLVFAYSTDGSTATTFESSWTPTTATWYHVAFERNGSDLKMYVNGTQVGSTHNISTDTIHDNSANLYIGCENNSSNWLDGSFASVKILNQAGLITALYNSGSVKSHRAYGTNVRSASLLALEAAEDLPANLYQADFEALTGVQYNASYDSGAYADSESNTISNSNTTNKAAVVNGKDSIGFNGTSSYQTINSIASTYNGNYEGYIVFKKETSGTFHNMASWLQYSNNDSYSFLVPRDSDDPQHSIAVEQAGPSNGTLLTESTSLGDEWAFLRYSYDGSNVKLSVNGSAAASVAQTSQFTSNDQVNRGALVRTANSSGTAFFKGQIAQDILFNTTNSAANIKTVENYMIAKYFPLFDLSDNRNHATLNNGPGMTGSTLNFNVEESDTTPPAEVTGVQITSFADKLTLSWSHADADGDLNDFEIYVDGVLNQTLASTVLTTDITSLSIDSTYEIKIVSVDTSGNKSSGNIFDAYTIMNNPSGLTLMPGDTFIDAAWTATEAVRTGSYKVYISTSDFTSVSGMTAAYSGTDSYARLSGLTNATTYYVAVTVVNVHGAENQTVTTVSTTPDVDADVLFEQEFDHSNLNRRTDVTFLDGSKWEYSYDTNGNVSNATWRHPSNSSLDKVYSYTFDDIGNRKTASEDGVSSTYTSNDLNQYTSIVKGGVTETISYDLDGNPLSKGDWTLAWDGESRLKSMTHATNGTVIEFTYDYRNFRIRKKVTVNSTVTEHIHYVYDDKLVSAELDLLDNNKVIRSYTWGVSHDGFKQGVGGIGGLTGMEEPQSGGGSKDFYYVQDAGGNVISLREAQANTTASSNSYEYGPFGQMINKTESVDNPYQYNTKYFDDGTDSGTWGLRHYNPDTGRWFNRDPIGTEGGINIYNSVSNNMVNGFTGGLSHSSGMNLQVGASDIGLSVDSWGEYEEALQYFFTVKTLIDKERMMETLLDHIKSDWAGEAILLRWLFGGGQEWNIVNDGDWNEYMKADEYLARQLSKKLYLFAKDHDNYRYIASNKKYPLIIEPFAAEFRDGEGVIGYDYLHGTNKFVGDFQMKGKYWQHYYEFELEDGTCKYKAFDVRFTWNDIIDPNNKYKTDRVKAKFAKVLSLGGAADYNIRITWREKSKLYFNRNDEVTKYEGYPFNKGKYFSKETINYKINRPGPKEMRNRK